MYDARDTPVPIVVYRAPQDAKLADAQAPPGRPSFQGAIVRVGRQRLPREHVNHRAQGRTVIVRVELA
jgi:hypothetical protein